MSMDLLIFSFFHQDLILFRVQFFHFLVKFIFRYLTLFNAIVYRIFFLISLSDSLLFMLKKAADFCMLILYPETLLNSFTSTNNFLIASLEFSTYGIMLSANYDSFASSFPIWIPFICCLIALVRTFSIMLNKSCKSGHP